MLLVQIHDKVGLGRCDPVQSEANRSYAESPDGDSLLQAVGNSSGKFQDEPIGMLRHLNRGSDCRAQSNFNANLAVAGEDLNLAHYSWTRLGGLSRQHGSDQERSQINQPLHSPSPQPLLCADDRTRLSAGLKHVQFLLATALVALVAIHTVVHIAPHALVPGVGLGLGVAGSTGKDRVVVGIRVARGAHAVGVAMV